MPKATITLPDGTNVVIDGSPEEVAKLLSLYGGASDEPASKPAKKAAPKKKKSRKTQTATSSSASTSDGPDLSAIIEQIKNCEWAEVIEKEILDKSGQVNRILLPLFVVHDYFDNKDALTSGDISRITTDLGIPIATANASRTLSGTASKYVIGDTVRKKGQVVRYKLSRRGHQYFKSLLEDASNDQ